MSSSPCQLYDKLIGFIFIGSIKRQEPVIKVPKIYWNYTRKAVLTMEWIDGIKLTDGDRISRAHLNRKELIDQV
jgi:predicted unusual protein kinase regulating ubiquinone biosynthesis (AarF/ABC1/UbiB family)